MKKRSKNFNKSKSDLDIKIKRNGFKEKSLDPFVFNKFKLYECAVQSPEWQINVLPKIHQKIFRKFPKLLREDFCGSGLISCEWAKSSSSRYSIGVDLDEDVLEYAKEINLKSYQKSVFKRVQFLKKNVLEKSIPKSDFIGVFNYSFYIFHQRKELLKYFKNALHSLNKKGTLFLEMIGGEGFKEALIDEREFKVNQKKGFQLIWEQSQYDPITELNHYRIHFRNPKGEIIENAFHYHWRLWSIRQVCELLMEAGFSRTEVHWSLTDENGEDSGELLQCEEVPTQYSSEQSVWMAYVVGVKDE